MGTSGGSDLTKFCSVVPLREVIERNVIACALLLVPHGTVADAAQVSVTPTAAVAQSPWKLDDLLAQPAAKEVLETGQPKRIGLKFGQSRIEAVVSLRPGTSQPASQAVPQSAPQAVSQTVSQTGLQIGPIWVISIDGLPESIRCSAHFPSRLWLQESSNRMMPQTLGSSSRWLRGNFLQQLKSRLHQPDKMQLALSLRVLPIPRSSFDSHGMTALRYGSMRKPLKAWISRARSSRCDPQAIPCIQRVRFQSP